MIVDCESCHTRFKLDDSRIPATGAKVRCSRCKAAFIVQRPNVTQQEVIDEVVAEATDPGSQIVPETTSDLFETSANIDFGPQSSPPSGGAAAAGDEQWEFDETPHPSPDRSPQAPARKPAKQANPVQPAPPDAQSEDDDLDSLGSPEDWDLLGGAARRVSEPASLRAEPAPERASRAIAEPRQEAAPEASLDATFSNTAASRPRESEAQSPAWRESLQAALGYAVEGAGWIAASALCVLGLTLALAPLPIPSEVPAAPGSVSLEGAPVSISLRSIESAVAGKLTLVRGELPASAASRAPARLRVGWIDANGAAVAGVTTIAGPPIPMRQLREFSLARLQADHASHALELRGGGAFEAVFGVLPAGTARIAIEQEAVAVVESPPVAAASAVAASATTSSRPTARPSSE